MKNIIGIPLLTFVGFIYFGRACGAPAEDADLVPNQILVRMHDNSTYQGFIWEIEATNIPLWMAPNQRMPRPPHYYVYIRTADNQHFMVPAPLEAVSLSPYHNPDAHLPLLAHVLIGDYRYVTARFFTFFEVNNPPTDFHTQSHVFIATAGGPIVSAVMRDILPPLPPRKRKRIMPPSRSMRN